MDSFPPGLILVLGALIVPLLRGRLQGAYMLLLPILSGAHLLGLPKGELLELQVFGYALNPVRIDALSLVWGYVFHIAALLSVLYALHVKDSVQHLSGLVYAGAGVGAVFAGDLVTLFVYWELTALSSVFLIWASRTESSYRAGMRYLVIQVGSGVILLAGILLRVADGGTLAFGNLMGEAGLADTSTLLIFLAFGIKAAFPLLHNWLQDAYPEATPTGTVFLSAFTTKLAIYALARGFAGTEELIWIGATMTAFPIFFAAIENDLRRVLAYILNNQLGYMVVGIGIGTEMALNGTAAHAFAHILYKSLLFMSMGAVLMRTGTCKGTELGGLYKSMPFTTVFCAIGGASIAFPLFSGFVTKSLILTAAAEEHHTVVFLVLLFASAGVFFYSGIKILYLAFFAHDSGRRVREAPLNMLLAMGITAALCIGIGCVPGSLYAILPYEVDFHPYTLTHVVTQYQILIFSALAFTVLMRTGIYPPEQRSVNLDTDWTYRKALPGAFAFTVRVGGRVWGSLLKGGMAAAKRALRGVYKLHGPEGVFCAHLVDGEHRPVRGSGTRGIPGPVLHLSRRESGVSDGARRPRSAPSGPIRAGSGQRLLASVPGRLCCDAMRLSELFSARDLIVGFDPSDKWEAIRKLVDHLVLTEKLPPENVDSILEAVLSRERSMSTGMERGIAIPHAAVDGLDSVVACMGLVSREGGLSFESIDGQPARIVVLLVIPRQQKLLHIRTLADVARVLSREDVRESILSAKDSEAAYQALTRGEIES